MIFGRNAVAGRGYVWRALDVVNSRDAVARLDTDEKNTVVLTDGTPGNPQKTIVNEPGLYTLILGSRKPEAKVFKRWITHEVIPTIRKHGAYSTRKPDSYMIDDPIARAQRWIEETQGRLAVPPTREWDVTCVHHVQQANIACY